MALDFGWLQQRLAPDITRSRPPLTVANDQHQPIIMTGLFSSAEIFKLERKAEYMSTN
jgi:hypothetical protein